MGRVAMGLGLVPKPHIQMQFVSGAPGRLSTVATQNQYPGEAAKTQENQSSLPRWIVMTKRACISL